MTDTPTINPDDLSERSVASPDLFALVFASGGPLQKLAFKQLLAKLIAADLTKATVSALTADLAHVADSVALVFNDPVAENNGWWRKTGASGAGGWTQFEMLTKAALVAVQAARDEALTHATNAGIAMKSAIKNGLRGGVLDAEGGFAGFVVSASMSRSWSVYSENADGTKGTTWFGLNTKLPRFDFNVPVAATSTLTVQSTVRVIDTPNYGTPKTLDGTFIFATIPGVRYAWGVAGAIWYDGIDQVLRVPAAKPSDETKPTNALVRRGGGLGIAKPVYPAHVRSLGYYPYIAQGGAMRSKGLRSHQLIPAIGKSNNWLYCVFDAANNTLGAAYNIPGGLGPEVANSYCVVMRRPLAGGAWEEVAQILPSNAAARCAIPMIAFDGDRILILFSFSSLGSTIHTWALGCYGVMIENPDCPAGGKLVFNKPRMMTYGIPGAPVMANGEIYSVMDVWRWADSSTYTQYGLGNVTLGSRLTRIVTKGPGAPYAEPLSYITGLPSGVDNSAAYYETALAMTNGGGWLVHQRASDGIYETTCDADLTSWPVPVSASAKTNVLNSSRPGLTRTPMGNILMLGNLGTGNRWNMGLRISEDEGATFAHETIVDARNDYNVSYPNGLAWIDPSTGRSKIAFVYDYGRGIGTGYPADIMYFEAWEDELLAGTSAAARQTINSLAYTGA